MAITRLGGANAITGTIPTSVAPGQGKVLQVVRNYVANQATNIETTSTSLVASGIQASITPTASGNLILVDFVTTMVDHTGSNQDGYGRMYQKIGSASITPMDSSHDFHIGYMFNGSNRYAGFTFSGSYTATSTDTLLYEPYTKSPSGGTFRLVHHNASYALTLTEVEQ